MERALFKLAFVLCLPLLWLAPALAGEQLTIPGTGDSQKLLREAAFHFRQTHPDVTIEIPDSVGSVGGIKRVFNDEAVLARIARPLNDSEHSAGLDSVVFAYTPVVIVANLPDNCADNISTPVLTGIYSEARTSWQGIGRCPDHKIYVANREEGDSSRILLEEKLPSFKKITEFAGEIIYSTPETLAIIEEHPYTIGYLPLAILKNSPLTHFSLDGRHPTAENLATGLYPLAIPLGITWKQEPTGTYRQFLDFLFSTKGQEIINKHGAVPAPRPAGF